MRLLPLPALLFLAFTGAAPALAQNITHPGFIVTADGDTLSGTVRLLQRRPGIAELAIRTDSEPNFRTLAYESVSAVVLDDGRRFVLSNATVDGKKMALFFEELVAGPVSLLFAPAVHGEEVFLLTRAGKEPVPVRERYYVGTLANLFAECSDLGNLGENQLLRRYRYGRAGMSRAIIDYNACVRPDLTQVVRKRRGRTLRYGFSVALTRVDVAFSEPESGLSALDFDKGIGFSFGTFGRLGFSGDRFAMQSELELEFKQASFEDADCVNSCFSVDVEMLYLHLNLPLAIHLRVSGIDWSLQAGPSAGLLIASKVDWTLPNGQSGNLDLEPIEVGYVAGIEVAVTGRVHVGIRYHGGWTLSNNAVFQTNQRTTGIGAGMLF